MLDAVSLAAAGRSEGGHGENELRTGDAVHCRGPARVVGRLHSLDARVELGQTRLVQNDLYGAARETALDLLREKGWLKHQAAVTLPSGEASYRTRAFPFADAKRIAQAVSFEVDGQFPVPLDELAFDHVVIPR